MSAAISSDADFRFSGYVASLSSLLESCSRSGVLPAGKIEVALNGEPSRELRRSYSTLELRASGTFLTSSVLAERLVGAAKTSIVAPTIFCDPACGAGDLLVAAARTLPLGSDFEDTMFRWGQLLAGFDLQPLLIRTAKIRLCLLAISRGMICLRAPDIDNLFPWIRIYDGTKSWPLPAGNVAVLLNPPFTQVEAPANCCWATGRVSQAALFIEACLGQEVAAHMQIFAILPDVLRSGSRYRKWRAMITEVADVTCVTRVGRFDNWADVDIFTARFRSLCGGTSVCEWAIPGKSSTGTVADFFDIRVGSVVTYRHVHKGKVFPFASARALPVWQLLRSLPERIRSTQTTYPTPLVLIRRTSRVGDRFRAVGTILTGVTEVAVENHLLVALPKDHTLRSCKALLEILRDPRATDWLNERICCRHLTTSAFGELPWTVLDE